ncbi:glycerophosphodiester phosphodiesterase [Exiguobacterium algae]|uniref:glycerophosphodiester phosphodiesterase n=1 Tax=Exiguobacterium algae TaxID=2751250 RepID=UPI001BE85AEE|nr:glycerophosphodiester phosphodiesterase [Exiguobacterium algae]
MKLFAHRGVMAQKPENTMSSFRLALDASADGIETDVHMTRDGELVLIHDEHLERTTDGTGMVHHQTLQELRQYNAGVRFGLDEQIPTLDELLELIKDGQTLLNLEIKTDRCRYPGIEEKVIERLSMFSIDLDRVIFSSFNHNTIHRLKQLEPRIECALLLAQPLFDLPRYMQMVGADSVHPHVDVLTDEDILHLQSIGIRVRPYTVKQSGQLQRFERLGVDAVFVNDVQWATHVLTP